MVAGFWLGLWQGFIAPFVFVASLFKSNLSIYEVHNNGAWYNLAYLFGLACFFGGGGNRGGASEVNFFLPELTLPLVDACCTRRYSSLMKAEVPKPTLLKRILSKARELFNRPTDVHYTSVPIWRPWRRF